MKGIEAIIRGTPDEIAALVLAVQERQKKMISIVPSGSITEEDRKQLADSVSSALLASSLEETQPPQPDSTRRAEQEARTAHGKAAQSGGERR